MYIRAVSVVFMLIFLGFTSACDQATTQVESKTEQSILPRALVQTRNLNSDLYRITVMLDNVNQAYDLTHSTGQFMLKLKNRIANGSHALSIEVDIPLNSEFRELYNYSGTLTVSGDGTTSLSASKFTWPDEDKDGHTNFIELDQSSIDLDNDGVTNERDLDADGDGTADNNDPTPFASSNEPQMINISSGCFQMGSDTSGDDEEIPVHQVCLKSFQLSKHEATFNQYDTYTDAQSMARVNDEGWGRGTRPVINVNWVDIQDYISWLNSSTGKNYRLPTESEWEYAARAGTSTNYHWGNNIGQNRANCDGCGSRWDNKQTAPTGSFSANAWGLLDMNGNVWERIEDCWHSNYKNAPEDGSFWGLENSGNCERRMVRGGAWKYEPVQLRAMERSYAGQSTRSSVAGFRLAHDR